MNKKSSYNLIPIFSMILVFILDLTLILTTHQSWNSSMNKYLPLKSQIQDIKNNISLGHLWFEEAIGGDEYIDIKKDVMNRFEHQKFSIYVKESKSIFMQKQDLLFYEKLHLIDSNLETLFNLAVKRWGNKDKYSIGSYLDQEFDTQFNIILNIIDQTDNLINSRINQELQDRNTYFKWIIVLFFIVNIGIFLLLIKLKHFKEKYEFELYKEKEKAIITLHSISDAVVTTDTKGNITYVNDAVLNIMKYEHSEVLNKKFQNIFQIKDKTTNQHYDSIINNVLFDDLLIEKKYNSILTSKYKQEIHIIYSLSPMKNQQQKTIGAIFVFHDKTKEVQIEQQIKQKEKIIAIQNKNAALGEMLENIAHQWRQPLSIMSTIATGIKLKMREGIDNNEVYIKDLDKLNQTAQSLSETINIFNNFSKNNTNKETVVLQNVLNQALELNSSVIKNNFIKLTKEYIPEPIFVNILVTELIQVILTIICNAKDIFNEKQIEKKQLIIRLQQKNDNVKISLEDNAGGIPLEIIDKIFEPYFTTKHKSQGTGLGLYMGEDIIKKYFGGKLYVTNTQVGAKFVIEFPIMQ